MPVVVDFPADGGILTFTRMCPAFGIHSTFGQITREEVKIKKSWAPAYFLIFIMSFQTVAASVAPGAYVSPGIQLAFSPEREVSLSLQVTVGILWADNVDDDMAFWPRLGLTIGIILSYITSSYYTHTDFQLAIIYGGVGIGKLKDKKSQDSVHRCMAWYRIYLLDFILLT